MPNCGVTTVTKLMCTLYWIAYGWTGINNMPLGDEKKKTKGIHDEYRCEVVSFRIA